MKKATKKAAIKAKAAITRRLKAANKLKKKNIDAQNTQVRDEQDV